MKILSKISSLVIALALAVNCLIFTSSAASSATLFFSEKTVEVGDKATVSVSVNPGEAMYAVSFYLEYNEDVLKYDSGDGTQNSAGVINVVESPTGQKKVSYSFTFTAVAAGSSAISVKDCVYATPVNGTTTEKKFTGASSTMTVKDPELSDNAKLKSLKISGYSLSPSFSSSKTSYTAKVPYDVKKVNITAVTSDSDAKTSVSGNTNLKVGSNTVTVTVEAPNGTQKKYTIKVTRAEEEKEEEEDTSSEETAEDATSLETVIAGSTYSIATKIPEDIIFDGFKIEETDVNGYTIETAVDPDGNYRIFYLSAPDSDELLPYLYYSDLDTFERVEYATFGKNTYIFSAIPEDYTVPESLYPSNVNIGEFTVECLADTASEMSDYRYVYCFFNGDYNLYRYDTAENTLQRYPDFELSAAVEADENDNFFTRFSSLSTNGKVIMVALLIVISGILALLVLLIVYLIRRSLNRDADILLYSDDDGFDEIEVRNDNTAAK